MSNEKLIKAMGLIDDDLIMDAEIKPPKKKAVVYYKYIAAAASLILIILVSFILKNDFNSSDNKPESNLLVELANTEAPFDNQQESTEAPIPSEKIIQTNEPVSDNLIVENTVPDNNEQFSNTNIITPEPTVEPVPQITAIPEENTDTQIPAPEEDDSKNESSDDVTVTETPGPTMSPLDESDWTEEFVASNIQHGEVYDKATAVNFVGQLYYSSFTSGADVFYENNGEWWYGIKNGEVLYTQAGVNIPESHVENFMGESVLKGINRINYTSKETKAYMYKISGVAENAAIAVKIDEQEGYYLFVNTDYKAETLKEFVEAFSLEEYVSINSIAVYNKKDVIICETVNENNIWQILKNCESSVTDFKKIYFEYDVTATMNVSSELYGYINVPIALYSEGYIVVYLGDINGAYYVGPNTISLLKGQVANAK